MRRGSDIGEVGIVGFILSFQFLMMFGYLALGGLATEYVIEVWGAVIKGVEYGVVDVPFWACVIAGLFIGGLTIPAAAFTCLFVLAGIIL